MALTFRTPPPEVRLVNAFARPLDNAIAAARTCYASKGIVTPEDVGGDLLASDAERAEALRRRDAMALELYQAGHHTVFQHAHFQFAIDRVSRHALWAFFHAHPFYNSEQVSQRYVKVGRGSAVVPDLGGRAQEVFEGALQAMDDAYHALTAELGGEGPAARIFFELFPARGRRPQQWRLEIRRKAQEAARYVLPVATWARLYHTISGVTLLRYRRLCAQPDIPSELRAIVDAMVAEVVRAEPAYAALFEAPIRPEDLAESRALAALGGLFDAARAAAFREEFDASLEGHVSRLVGFAPDAEAVVAQAVRETLGIPRAGLSDDDALALVADPARNPLSGESLNLQTLGRLTRALHHASYTFRKKISHTADSQDQRHRMTPASRPVLLAHLGAAPDVILPQLIADHAPARARFDETMARTWDAIGELRRLGVPDEALAYLLPNAAAVRFTESGDYAALHHKHAMRLCYNAQEEIWHASVDEARQVAAVHPRLGRFLLPPCSIRLRAGTTPYCPEGKRYCGVPVWKLEPAAYVRRL